MRVLFLCSNDTHVRMFSPVAGVLSANRASSVIVSLDEYYGQGAEAMAEKLGMVAVPLRRPDGALVHRGFYHRGAMAVWRDVLRARGAVHRLMQEARPDAVVVGNDSGLMEKLFLAQAAHVGAGTVLVQDGRLAAGRPASASARTAALRTVKRAFSPLLNAAGLRYLGASEYGASGVDTICATGVRTGELLRARAGPNSRVVITGQPRYDPLVSLMRVAGHDERKRIVTIFTTPFASSRLGAQPQRAQDDLVVALEQELAATNRYLYIKPHPRESTAHYEELARRPTTRIVTEDPAELLVRSGAAVIGMSSVVEEAGLLGCPVVVPGRIVHGVRFDEHLPDATSYPRFESASEAVAILERVLTGELPLARQQSALIRQYVHVDAARPAAEAVAAAILG